MFGPASAHLKPASFRRGAQTRADSEPPAPASCGGGLAKATGGPPRPSCWGQRPSSSSPDGGWGEDECRLLGHGKILKQPFCSRLTVLLPSCSHLEAVLKVLGFKKATSQFAFQERPVFTGRWWSWRPFGNEEGPQAHGVRFSLKR